MPPEDSALKPLNKKEIIAPNQVFIELSLSD